MASSDPAKPGDHDVLRSLPDSRPTRRSAKRSSAGGAASAKPKRTTPAKATASAKPKARPAPKPRAAARPKPKAAPAPPPRSTVPPAGYATPRKDEEPSGRGDLLGTAVQAAGEITQIAAAAGSRAVRSALKRFPRP